MLALLLPAAYAASKRGSAFSVALVVGSVIIYEVCARTSH